MAVVVDMRFASILTMLLCYVALSNGQFPSTGGGEHSPAPPLVSVRPEPPRPSPEMRRKQMLADLEDLIKETQTLKQEVLVSRGQTVSAQSFKRSQKIEGLAKRIRKDLKD